MQKQKIISGIIVLVLLVTQSFSNWVLFSSSEVEAAWPVEENKLVAMFVEQNIYETIKANLQRYTLQYIHWRFERTKVLVFPVDTSKIQATDIQKILSNYYETQTAVYAHALTQANFNNCIIYGSNQVEMILDKVEDDSVPFNRKFTNCLIRFNNINNQFTNNDLYFFNTDPTHYVNCTIATNSSMNKPKYEDLNNNKLWLTEDLNLPADAASTALVPFDILNHSRITSTDLGAYQFVP